MVFVLGNKKKFPDAMSDEYDGLINIKIGQSFYLPCNVQDASQLL